MLRRITSAAALVLGVLALFTAPALADHGQAHNGETAEISETEDLAQDDVVTVTGIGYAPGSTLTVVQCFIFPATGPADCELSNYGQFTAEVGDDGTASIDYTVNIVEGKCDADNPCFVVISDNIGPAANAIGMEVTFAAAVEETTTTTEAPTTTTAAPTTTEAPTTTAEATTAAPETSAPETSAVAAAAEDASDDDDDGGSTGLIVAGIIGLVVIGGLGAFLASRNKT